MNKCIVCSKEFKGRIDAKFCSSTCRSRANRATDNVENATLNDQNATDNPINVSKPEINVATDNSSTSVDATDNAPKHGVEPNKWDVGISTEKDPLKRITIVPNSRVDMDYYYSQTFKNLVEELESKPITQLKKENYWIPAWRYSGKKRPNIQELIK